MNTVELSKTIRTFLLTKCLRVYKQKAPEKAMFPYVTFKLPSSFDYNPAEDFVLEIDGWDISQDTTALELLMDSLDGDGDSLNPTGLHKKTIISNGLTVTFYRETRGELDDEDPSINRRQIRYTARTYYKGA